MAPSSTPAKNVHTNDTPLPPSKRSQKEPAKKIKAEESNPPNDNNQGKDEKTKTHCAPNYTEDKNIQICCLWLDVTDDPLNSTNQTADTFWDCVKQHHMKKIPHPA
ncbi:hypothetical protein PCANC_11249 [Puccinia coronata f. sp. avenae]|uniref:No apical meristem-associated C-terminal domain-containing protein n=1 Tax=Puccinia coronata f. sp. avenae TaxID=200324 RepID=A0A2N5T6A4_9BASI|nr:hypothetical protein PCANC_11249 [Puccinia coronata f. sp. avenae]